MIKKGKKLGINAIMYQKERELWMAVNDIDKAHECRYKYVMLCRKDNPSVLLMHSKTMNYEW